MKYFSIYSNDFFFFFTSQGFPGDSVVKNPPAIQADAGSLPGLGRSPGGGHGNPLQYSCLKNPMGRGARQATVQRVTQSGAQCMCILQTTTLR